MTQFAKLLAATALAAAPFAAQAQLVTVDLNRLYADSVAGKSGSSQITAKYQGQAQSQATALNTAIQTYNTQVEAAKKVQKPDGSVPDANQQQLAQAEQRLRQADETLNRTQQEANAVGQYVQQQILRAALPIAEQIRAEKKALAVVPRGSVLAADPSADITPTLIQRLDGSLKTVSIVLPQQPAQGGAAGAARPATPAPAARPAPAAGGR